jgi:tRNA (uracil-5-)-methyltransferase
VLEYRQPEGCFTQPNAAVNRAMLGWARDACGQRGGDLLELYCGIGNFTVALAPLFRTVLATEIDTTAIAAARHNLTVNGIGNCTVARLSSAEAASALARERPFRRLAGFDLDDFSPCTLLVDPPRAGLDARTLAFAAGFERLVYISCNPVTLRANLAALGSGFVIERFAMFDQFPYTHHLECGVLLRRHSEQP